MKAAHIITDMTDGFTPICPTELPVAETLDPELNVIGAINRTSQAIRKAGGINIFSRDWHFPGNIGLASTYPNRAPFSINAASWPDHSMANTQGAEFVSEMEVKPEDSIVYKGYAFDHPFSAFAGSTMKPSPKGWVKGPDGVVWIPDKSTWNILDESNVDTLFGDGVAGEYCVDGGLVDASKTGRKTYAVTDAIAFLDPTKRQEMYEKWQDVGIILITSHQVAEILAQ